MTTIDVIEQVVLVKGRILHAGSGEPIVGRIWITSPQGWVTDRQKHWIGHKIFPDGKFVVFDQLDRLFPKLEEQGYPLTLEIHVDSPQFRTRPLSHKFTINVPKGRFSEPLDQKKSKPFDKKTLFLPVSKAERKKSISINIHGRVLGVEDKKSSPLYKAVIEIFKDKKLIKKTDTNLEGLYEFKDIVILGSSEICCSADGYTPQKRRLFIDFSQAIYQGHREDFRLVKKPGTKK